MKTSTLLLLLIVLTSKPAGSPGSPQTEPVEIKAKIGDSVEISFEISSSASRYKITTARGVEVAICYRAERKCTIVENGNKYIDKTNSTHFIVEIQKVEEKHCDDTYRLHGIPYPSYLRESRLLCIRNDQENEISDLRGQVLTLKSEIDVLTKNLSELTKQKFESNEKLKNYEDAFARQEQINIETNKKNADLTWIIIAFGIGQLLFDVAAVVAAVFIYRFIRPTKNQDTDDIQDQNQNGRNELDVDINRGVGNETVLGMRNNTEELVNLRDDVDSEV